MSKQHHHLLSKLENPEICLILLEDMAKRWLAHDGLWFQAVEKEYGMDAAAWEKFTVWRPNGSKNFSTYLGTVVYRS